LEAPEKIAQYQDETPLTAVPASKRQIPWKSVIAAGVAFVVGLSMGAVANGNDEQLNRARAKVRLLEHRNTELEAENGVLQDDVTALEDEVSTLEGKVAAAEDAAAKAEEAAAGNGKDINIDYSQWDGLFAISGTNWIYDYGWELVGQIEYLGGADCKPRYVEVNATYWRGGKIIGSDFTNFTSLTEGSPLPLEIYGPEGAKPDRVDLVLSEANC
jgi:cell division protein FtsB